MACSGGDPAPAGVEGALLPYKQGKVGIYPAYGYMDQAGTVHVASAYKQARPFHEGVAWVEGLEGFGILGPDAQWVMEPTAPYTYTEDFQGGVAAVKSAKKLWGLLDQSGREVVEPRYQSVATSPDGISIGFSAAGCDYLSSTGETLGSFKGCKAFSEGLGGARDGAGWFYVNAEMTKVIPGPFDEVYSFSEERAWVQKEVKGGDGREPSGGWQLIDAQGAVVADFDDSLRSADPFAGGLAKVGVKGGFRFVNRSGTFAFEGVFEAADSFHDGLGSVKGTSGWTYIDPSGSGVLGPFQVEEGGLLPFHRGAAWVREQDQAPYGLMDADGAWRVEPNFGSVGPFTEGWAPAVRSDGARVWVSSSGAIVEEPR